MKVGKSKFSSPGITQQQNRALGGQLTVEDNISAKRLTALTLEHNKEITLTHNLKRLPDFIQSVQADKVINFEIDSADTREVTFRPLLPSSLVTRNDLTNLGAGIYDVLALDGNTASSLDGVVDTGAGVYALNIDVSGVIFKNDLTVGTCVYIAYSGSPTTIGGISSSSLFPACFPIITTYVSGGTKYIYVQTTTNNGFTTTSGSLTGVYTVTPAPGKWQSDLSYLTIAGKTFLPYLANKTAVKDFYKLNYKFDVEIYNIVSLPDNTISFYPHIADRGEGEGITITFKTAPAPADSPATYQYYVEIGATEALTGAALVTKLQSIAKQVFISGTDNGVYWKEVFALSQVGDKVYFEVLPKDYVFRVGVSSTSDLPITTSNLEVGNGGDIKYFGGENCYGRSGPPLGKGYTHVSYVGQVSEIDINEDIIPIRWQGTYLPSGGLDGSFNFVCFSTPEYSQSKYEAYFPTSEVGLVRLSFAAYPYLDFVPVSMGSTFSAFLSNLATAISNNLGNYLVSLESSGGSNVKVRLHRQFFIDPPNANSVFVPASTDTGFLPSIPSPLGISLTTSNDTSRTIRVSTTNGFAPGTKFYIIQLDGTIDDGYVVDSVTENMITYTGAKPARLSEALEILQVSEALVNVLIL